MYHIVFLIPDNAGAYLQEHALLPSDISEPNAFLKATAEQFLNNTHPDLASQIKLIFFPEDGDSFLDGETATPAFAAYFSINPECDAPMAAMADALSLRATPIYTIALQGELKTHLPEPLRKYQGTTWADFEKERRTTTHPAGKTLSLLVEDIIQSALESFHLSSARKVFISYAQKQTQKVAFQIYNNLNKRLYLPFLDRCALTPGCLFQQNLEHELRDCDVMLLLDSGLNRSSEWCEIELQIAQTTGMGLVLVTWQKDAHDYYSQRFQLCEKIQFPPLAAPSDCPSEFSETELHHILNAIDSIRARAFFSKTQKLVDQLNTNQSGEVRTVFNKNAFMVENEDNGVISRYFPIVGVPTSPDFNRAHFAEVGLLYNSYCITDAWKKHLTWLQNKTQINLVSC